MQNLSKAEVDALLVSRRKIRGRNKKACYPCHRRKIKCDQNLQVPCTNCQRSPHPELCSFQGHRGRRASSVRATSPRNTSKPRSEHSVPMIDGQTPRQAVPTYEDTGDALHSEVRASERR